MNHVFKGIKPLLALCLLLLIPTACKKKHDNPLPTTSSGGGPVTPAGANHHLTVALSGSGSGSVSSIPAGINCGSACQADFADGASITLTPTASSGTFSGWSGACTGSGNCTVVMNSDKSVTASFSFTPPPPTQPLTVVIFGPGSGNVTSAPSGINCGVDCSENYNQGTVVVLSATPNASSVFSSWSGACTGSGLCTLTMSASASVSATFALKSWPLTVSKSGTGAGTVTSAPAAISCGGTCSATLTNGTAVTLSETPDAFSSFSGWSGACSGTGTCPLTMDAAKSADASFAKIPFNGTWNGMNSQGSPFSMTVANNAVSGFSTTLFAPANTHCSAGTFTITTTYGTPLAITANAFSTSGSSSLNGAFSSATNGTGSLTYFDSVCVQSVSVNWSAANSSAFAAARTFQSPAIASPGGTRTLDENGNSIVMNSTRQPLQ